MSAHDANASAWPLNNPDLQGHISALERDQKILRQKVKDLLFREDPDAGIFFHETLFALQQEVLTLETTRQILETRQRRLHEYSRFQGQILIKNTEKV